MLPCTNCGQRPMRNNYFYWCDQCVEEAKDLFDYLDLYDDDELPDAAWFARLEEAVETYNDLNGTSYDPNEAVLIWASIEEEE